MADCIIYTHPTEGGLCVVTPGIWSLDECLAKVIPPGAVPRIVNRTDLPQDRSFRNAWEVSPEGVTENWEKSVALTKERLRVERAPLLKSADIAALRDIEATGVISPETLTLKQALRDITALADAAKSRDELIALKAAAVVKV